MIHQQQLEGMFNCYDIKTYPNMDAELQQARIQISGPNSGIENITQEKLQHIRKELRSSIGGVELESFTENAQVILDTFLIWRH